MHLPDRVLALWPRWTPTQSKQRSLVWRTCREDAQTRHGRGRTEASGCGREEVMGRPGERAERERDQGRGRRDGKKGDKGVGRRNVINREKGKGRRNGEKG